MSSAGSAGRAGAGVALGATVGAAAVEAIRAGVAGDPPLDAFGALLVGFHALSLFGLVLLPVGAGLGALSRWLPPEWWPEALPARLRAGLGRSAGAAALVGLLVGVAIAIAGVFAGARLVAGAHNKPLAALTLAVLVVGALSIATVVGRSVQAAARRALEHTKGHVTGWIALLTLGVTAAGGIAAVAWRFRDLFAAIDLGFAVVAGGALIGASGVAAARLGPATWRRLVLVHAVLLLASAHATLFNLRRDPDAFSALSRRSALASFVWRAGVDALDRDGDGVASLLGGDDCDDGDPARAPGLLEVADNGIDEDCDGTDLSIGAALEALAAMGPVAAGSAAAAPAVAPEPDPAELDLPRFNVVHVMVDTMRADRLGRHRDGVALTPSLDALAGRGARFSYASSTGPNTKYASPVFFTGRYFSEIPRNGRSWVSILDSATTIAERARSAGIKTAGVSAHWWVTTSSNLKQGFERWESEDREISGDRVANRGIRYLEERAKDGEPFYLWLHFYDVHNDWNPEPEWAIFGDCLLCRYDAEVRYTDHHIGRLLDAIQRLGLGENTAVVVHGDHGEAFGEHGMVHHGTSLYWEQLGVPMIVAVPGAGAREVATPVSTVDIPRTVLDLMRVDADPALHGVSLVPYAMTDAPPAHPPLYAEIVRDPKHEDVRAWTEGGYKLIWWVDEGRMRLYHVDSDPRETTDIAKDRPDLVKLLRMRLQAFMAGRLVDFPVEIIPEPDDEVADADGPGKGEGG